MNDSSGILLTDLYQLTMLQAYHHEKMEDIAVFEFFVRKLPAQRNFFVAAGLEQVLEYLQNLQFTEDELGWLRSTGRFNNRFVDYLAALRFTGDVHAVPEGTVFFPDEPILRVTAPLPEAQLVESRIINLLQFQTLIASKAVRCVLAAPDRQLVDFGMRRAHGAEAALLAGRACYLAGFAGTATVSAGYHFGIPIFGTMAHSYIQAHDDESAAFEHFAQANPDNVVLLLDTYDTEEGARKTATLSKRLRNEGIAVRGVRLDSGDLAEHARRVRQILDDAGLSSSTIFASGGLDEFSVEKLINSHAPIDGFGIGSRLDCSADAPYLDCAYKLQEYAGRARRKKSEGKATWPGRKQLFREFRDGQMRQDTVGLEDEQGTGRPLLEAVMKGGQLVRRPPSLEEIREVTDDNLKALPEGVRTIGEQHPYEVNISKPLRQLAATVDARRNWEVS